MDTRSMPQQENRPIQNSSAFIHLISGGTALLILLSAVLCFNIYATSREDKNVHALAPQELDQTSTGIVIQQAAFRQSDLLPAYGSSEMLWGDSPYKASSFFATYPTGFNVIVIAKGGVTSLNLAQTMAALGPELKGRKVVISFTPIIFKSNRATEYAYNGNFSRMHAVSLAFSPTLSMAVKQRAAKRMLEYPAILSQSNDPLLSFTLQNLAGGKFYNRILYYLTFPLGLLDFWVIRLQDHYAVWEILNAQPTLDQTPLHQDRAIDWSAIIDQAEVQQKAFANNNPYGIENTVWIQDFNQVLDVRPPGSNDQEYINQIAVSEEWGDLVILLDVLNEIGAQPLLLSRPIDGPLYTAAGISRKAQQAFYVRLKDIVSAYAFPLVDFQEYTDDRFFSTDESSHPSRKGWVIVDQVLDSFYHGNIR